MHSIIPRFDRLMLNICYICHHGGKRTDSWWHLRRCARAVTRLRHQSNAVIVHTVDLHFPVRGFGTGWAGVHRCAGRAIKNKVLRKTEGKETLECLSATSKLWSEICEKLKNTADIWAEDLQSWTQLRLHLRHTHMHHTHTHTSSHSCLFEEHYTLFCSSEFLLPGKKRKTITDNSLWRGCFS